MEGRDRQNLGLSTDTHAINKDGNNGHNGNKSKQLPLIPSCWERIGLAALKKNLKFDFLLSHFNQNNFKEAFKVLNPNKALGIDFVSKKIYGKNLEANLEDLVRRIQVGSYKPQTKREVLIPKANGKTRPIAISCFEDKMVEWVLGKILKLIYEPLFIHNSFGFRPFKSAHGAIRTTYKGLKKGKHPFVVEIDFANFFNSIPHRKLMRIISKRITDKRFKGLLGRFLKVGILDGTGIISVPDDGTPQGSVMSPILANIYLNEVLDHWFIQNHSNGENIIVRYADDAVFLFKTEPAALNFLKELNLRVKSYGLTLNMEKTSVISFGKQMNNHFDFLGFCFYWGKKMNTFFKPLKIKTAKKSLFKKIHDFEAWIKAIRSKLKLSVIWKLAIAKLSGHYNYYGFKTNACRLNHFYFSAITSIFKWLNRRSQKISFSWAQFKDRLKDFPLPKPPLHRKLMVFERNRFNVM